MVDVGATALSVVVEYLLALPELVALALFAPCLGVGLLVLADDADGRDAVVAGSELLVLHLVRVQ